MADHHSYVHTLTLSWKLPDIVKLYTCQLLYNHLIDEKPLDYTLSLVSEQHNYATWSASLQHLNPCFSRINIRKFCPTVIGCYYWNDPPLSKHNLAWKSTLKLLFCSVLIHTSFSPTLSLLFYPNYNSHLNKGIQLACYILPFSVLFL